MDTDIRGPLHAADVPPPIDASAMYVHELIIRLETAHGFAVAAANTAAAHMRDVDDVLGKLRNQVK